MKDTAQEANALPTILLGLDDRGLPRHFHFEKNLLSIAGAGAGKGASQIILNLKHVWRHNAVVIDPSGEAAEASIKYRTQDGIADGWNFERDVAVIDPYRYANVPGRHRATFNPLDLVESAADLRNLANGLITRTDTDKGHWTDSAEDVATGLLAFILQDPSLEEDERHIGQLRQYIGLLSDPKSKPDMLEVMQTCEGYGGLSQDIARRLAPDNTEVQNVLGTLRTQTRWLNSEEIVQALSSSRFLPYADYSTAALKERNAARRRGEDPDIHTKGGGLLDLRKIKDGKLDVFLVVPGDRLQEDGIFLRLFVRALISIMMGKTKRGDQMGERCLFILDECYAIGHLKELTFASGQMRKYGLHLWPFFQSVAQITELYGRDGLEILSEDADAMMVFGSRGTEILEYASKRLGRITEQDIWDDLSAAERALQEDERAQVRPYVWEVFTPQDGRVLTDRQKKLKAETLRSRIGNPRYTPDDLRALLSKPQDQPIAERMLVMHGAGYEFVKPVAHFQYVSVSKGFPDAARKAYPQRSRWSKIRPWLNVALIAAIILIPPLREAVVLVLAIVYNALFGWLPSYVQLFGFLALFIFGTTYLVSKAIAQRLGGEDMVRRLKSWWLAKLLGRRTQQGRFSSGEDGFLGKTIKGCLGLTVVWGFLEVIGVIRPPRIVPFLVEHLTPLFN